MQGDGLLLSPLTFRLSYEGSPPGFFIVLLLRSFYPAALLSDKRGFALISCIIFVPLYRGGFSRFYTLISGVADKHIGPDA